MRISKINWPVWIIVGSSLPIALILIGVIKVWMSESQGIVDTTTEKAVFFGVLYAAPPCGLLSIMTGIKIMSKGSVNKKAAVAGIILGVLSALMGLISWIWFFMISAFTAAYS